MGKLKNSEFIKEFKEFISRGSVMDLAVGVVIGGAFSSIVSALVNDIIMPVVGLIIGGVNFSDLYLKIDNFFGGNTAAYIRYGNFIQSVVNFLIIALSIFVVIRLFNKMNEKARAAAKRAEKKLGLAAEEKAEAEEKAAVEEKEANAETNKLLKDILKELKSSNKKK